MKHLHNYLITAILLITAQVALGQVGIGITTPDASAQLDVTATGKGLLVPRMTIANRPASPATGLIIYQTDGSAGFYYYDGSAWQMVSNATSAASAFNDTLIRNLYTAGYLVTADGTTGIKMYGNGVLVDTGTYGSGASLAIGGAGTRMVWNPKQGAFRAGRVTSTNWDSTNIGAYSTAFGFDSKASANGAFAAGEGVTASASYAVATGYQSTASQSGSVAMGIFNTASGASATAMGRNNTASGFGATGLGFNTTASGIAGTAMGNNSTASGNYSTAIGTYVSTNNKPGSMILGDSTTTTTSNDDVNQMMMRFTGGYKLYSNSALTQGILQTTTGATTIGKDCYASGQQAMAFGGTDTATGGQSVAMGANNKASANQSVALGYLNTSAGNGSFVVGTNSNSTGWGSAALGIYNTASNTGSIALGSSNTASGQYALVMGRASSASGLNTLCVGVNSAASGNYSIALGTNVSTNSKAGSCIIGDSTTTTIYNDATNQMMMRFNGGYKLYTNSAATQGVQLANSGVLKYMNNVSGSYDTRSLTDKGYVDSVAKIAFNDTLTRNLYTSGYLISADGSTGISMKDNGLLIDTGTNGSGASLTLSGAGTRMFWYPKVGAFRAGQVSGSQWDVANVGSRSVAFGWDNKASGLESSAFGSGNIASSQQSFAAGYQNSATGPSCIAMGVFNTASGPGSVAMGYQSTASNTGSVALGLYNSASGIQSFAVGNNASASGNNSIAIGKYVSTNSKHGSFIFGDTTATTISNDGYNQMMMRFTGGYKFFSNTSLTAGLQLTASGGANLGISNTVSGTNATGIGNTVTASATNSVAIGFNVTSSGIGSVALGSYVSTNAKNGSMIFGDSSTTAVTTASAANQMTMRFAGGYNLYTDAAASVGAQIAAGGNSWSTISDRSKKENFLPANGEDLLIKISKMPLSSWNYKGQDAKLFRHYGPMAQDFFAAFGKDKYGTSGNDTTINQADMEGVTFIAVQALEKRTQELQQENALLKGEMEKLKNDFATRLQRMEAAMSSRPTPVQVAPVK